MPDPSDSADSGSAYVLVKVEPDPGFPLTFDGMVATEEFGRPFLIHLDLSSDKAHGNLTGMLGSAVTVTMTAADKSKRHFNGILARIGYAGMTGGAYRYHVELRPWIWLLSRTHDCRIFQKESAFDIITKVFRDKGFTDFTDKRQNQAGDTVLDYCVQYRESGLDFTTRLMEQFGIYYYTTHADGVHTLVLADDPASHSPAGKAIPFYYSQTDHRSVEDHVWDFAADLNLQPGAYTFRDYNFTTPAADLTAKSMKPAGHPHSGLEVYDYPGPYETADIGQKHADVRMQELSARVQVFSGSTNSRLVYAGQKFTLSNFPDTALNQEYLVIRSTVSVTIAEGAADDRGGLIDSLRCEFGAIVGTVPFRLEQHTPKPMIRGPQTAKVVGESGEEITTDQYGRIKVQFYWDRVGTEDENSSCWIRVAQSWGGAGWGGMFIPRIGMEVVVEFLEGNPDRPLVTGVVYNATQTVPYPLPDKKVVSTIKSNSSKGGGGSNELRFDDTKGTEEVFFHAQYDYNKVVLNNETATITKDHTTTVKEGNRAITVSQGNDSKTVSQGNQSTTVSVGNHKIDISAGKSEVTAAQSITLTVGGASIKLEPAAITLTVGASSIKLDPASITVSTAKLSLSASGMAEISAGGIMNLTGSMININ